MKVYTFDPGLGLNSAEEKCISKCIHTYSGPLSIKTLINRIWNTVCSLFGKSDWQQAEKILILKGDLILKQRHTGQPFDSKAFAEFALRVFIHCQLQKRHLNTISKILLIPNSEINIYHSCNSITMDDLLDRAPFGNGISFPETIPYLRRKLIEEFNFFSLNVNRFENKLNKIHQVLSPELLQEMSEVINESVFDDKVLECELIDLLKNRVDESPLDANIRNKYYDRLSERDKLLESSHISFRTREKLINIFNSFYWSLNYLKGIKNEKELIGGTSVLEISRQMILNAKETIEFLNWIKTDSIKDKYDAKALKETASIIKNMDNKIIIFSEIISQIVGNV